MTAASPFPQMAKLFRTFLMARCPRILPLAPSTCPRILMTLTGLVSALRVAKRQKGREMNWKLPRPNVLAPTLNMRNM